MRERWVSTLAGTALELVFPGTCLLCGRDLLGRCQPLFPVCRTCVSGLAPIRSAHRCRTCSTPLISESGICTRCRARDFSFDRCYALYEYRGEIRELIYQFKFQNRRRVARVLGYLLGRGYREHFGDLPVVPVPGNPAGVRRRGWDPMCQVAGFMAGMFDLQSLDLLRRTGSQEQKGLGFDDRLRNIRGAIRLKRRVPAAPPGLVLVDDIFTTGATTSECARLLAGAGARRVEVLALAID